MPFHRESKILPYAPAQVFGLVADIEKYGDFLPWCKSCRIIKKTVVSDRETLMEADLYVGYKMFQERFRSRVVLHSPEHILVEYLSGPMKHLSNHWRFEPVGDNHTKIDFVVDFEFKNPLFQGIIELFFNEVVRRMVNAFEMRAKDLYG